MRISQYESGQVNQTLTRRKRPAKPNDSGNHKLPKLEIVEASTSIKDYNTDSNLHILDLAPYDIFPEIFIHLELKDLLNCSLVSTKFHVLVSPQIVRCAKVVFKAKPMSVQEELEIKSFRRLYTVIEFKPAQENLIIANYLQLVKLNAFPKLKAIVLTVSDIKRELKFLEILQKIGGFETFFFNFVPRSEALSVYSYLEAISTESFERTNFITAVVSTISPLLIQLNYIFVMLFFLELL